MKNRINNFYLTVKAGIDDFRKRRLISKRVILEQRRVLWNFSPWRYILVSVGLLAFFMTRNVGVTTKASSSELSRLKSSSNAILLRSITGSDEAINLAVKVAQQSRLPVEENVVWLAESNTLQKETASQSTELTVARAVPVFDLKTINRSIKTHVVKNGESIQQIADSYGISINTIKWANNMSKDTLEVGKSLNILPLDGIIYKVKDGDTLESLAEKYKSTVQRIQIFNDLEITGIKTGQEIIIPEGILPTEERPGYVAPVTVTYYTTYNYSYGGNMSGDILSRSYGYSGPTAGNKYVFGNCTWYAYERRAQIGRSINTGGTWGHAYSWAASARNLGYAVNKSPAVGAIIQTNYGGGGYGHVGVVERIEENGDIIISDMNYAGYNVVTWRRISSSAVGNYNYIH
ncbi:MAG: LysM peptidoglycan-binding domain-containing protein [Candidatus Saccharibacteria bacterium]|nr:LysM peptidoglycan-binding domain-containing protein [Candidatus Saccharibacteria bacterium]